MLNKRNKLIGISELALKIGLVNSKTKKPSTHTLRFWETKFKQLKPIILIGRRRYYSNKSIEVAKSHAHMMSLSIEYKTLLPEDLAAKGQIYDVLINMEVIEHVSDVSLFIKSCSHLLSKDGIMIFASLNRTLTSYGLAIIGVEYILGWLPRGTHDWNKFITPDELKVLFKSNQLKIDELKGVKYNPIFDTWKISNDLSVNYLGLSKKISF